MRDRIRYDLGYYVIAIILSILLWYFAFNLLHYPKNFESLYLFYGGDVKSYSFNSDSLNALKDNNIRKIEIVSENPANSRFEEKYQVVCFNGCDVGLLPVSVLDNTYCAGAFNEIDKSKYDLNVYSQNGKDYGYILSDTNKLNLSKYFIFSDEDYCLVAISSSVNSGEINDNSYKLIDWMINYGSI